MRRLLSTTTLLLTIGLGAATAWAVTDYSAMTTSQLANMRTTMQNATEQERNAFHNEWMKRMQQMSPSERQQYMQGQGAGMGNGMNQQTREQMQERMQQRQDQGGMMGGSGGSSGMGGGMGGMGGGMGHGGGRGR